MRFYIHIWFSIVTKVRAFEDQLSQCKFTAPSTELPQTASPPYILLLTREDMKPGEIMKLFFTREEVNSPDFKVTVFILFNTKAGTET